MGGCCSNPSYPCYIRCCCCCRTTPCTISCLKCCLPSGPYSKLRCDLCAYGPELANEEVQAITILRAVSVQNVPECGQTETQTDREAIIIEPEERLEIVEPVRRTPPPITVDAQCSTDPEPVKSLTPQPDSLSMTSFTKVSVSEENPLDLIDGYTNSPELTLRDALAKFDGPIKDLSDKIDEALQKCYFPNERKLSKDESAAIYIRSMLWPGTTLNDLLEEAWKKADRSAMKPWYPYLKFLIGGLEKLRDVEGEIWQGIEYDANCQKILGKKPPNLFTSMGFGTTSMGAIKRHLRKKDRKQRIILIRYKGCKAKDITEYIENSDQPTTSLLPGIKINTVEPFINEEQGQLVFHLERKEPAKSIDEPLPLLIPRKETHFACPNRNCINSCSDTDGKDPKHRCHGFQHLNHECGHHCGQGYRCYRCKKHNEKLHQCSACSWRFCKECCFH